MIIEKLRQVRRSYGFNLFLKNYVFDPIDRTQDQKTLCVNIGAGESIQRHWKTLDQIGKYKGGYHYQRKGIDYPYDMCSLAPMPFRDHQVSYFFSSHTFEHIPLRYCQFVFREAKRCLKKKGVFRIALPDYDLAYESYQKKDESFFRHSQGESLESKFLFFFASYHFDKTSVEEFLQKFRSMTANELADHYCNLVPEASQDDSPGNHITWWNFEKLERELHDAGFSNIRKCSFHSSPHSVFYGHSIDTTHPYESFYVEATHL